MLTILKSFPLDFACCDVNDTVFAKAGDRESRILEITPTKFGTAWEIPDGTEIRFAATRPDGGRIYNGCELTDDGKIRVILTDKALAVAGMMTAEIVLTGEDGEICSSDTFSVNVVESATSRGHELPDGESTAAENIISRMTELISSVLASLRSGAFNGRDGIDGQPGRDGTDGQDGQPGRDGADGQDGQPGRDGADGQDGQPGRDGADGQDGVSCTHSWSGTTLTVTSASGTSSANLKGEKGDKGDKGDPGDAGNFTIDASLSSTSTNPVQNKAVKAALDAQYAAIEAAITGGAW